MCHLATSPSPSPYPLHVPRHRDFAENPVFPDQLRSKGGVRLAVAWTDSLLISLACRLRSAVRGCEEELSAGSQRPPRTGPQKHRSPRRFLHRGPGEAILWVAVPMKRLALDILGVNAAASGSTEVPDRGTRTCPMAGLLWADAQAILTRPSRADEQLTSGDSAQSQNLGRAETGRRTRKRIGEPGRDSFVRSRAGSIYAKAIADPNREPSGVDRRTAIPHRRLIRCWVAGSSARPSVEGRRAPTGHPRREASGNRAVRVNHGPPGGKVRPTSG